MTDEKTASPEGPAIEKVRRGCLKGEPSILETRFPSKSLSAQLAETLLREGAAEYALHVARTGDGGYFPPHFLQVCSMIENLERLAMIQPPKVLFVPNAPGIPHDPDTLL